MSPLKALASPGDCKSYENLSYPSRNRTPTGLLDRPGLGIINFFALARPIRESTVFGPIDAAAHLL
jgi:hypothetical protein